MGYIFAIFMGMVDFSGLHNVGFIALPHFMPFKPEFEWGAIISIIAIYLVSATETIGDTSALCESALNRQPHKQDLGNSITCDGFVSSISGLFGCTPITSFSQNVGLAAMSGVVNRFAIGTGACIMILGGLFPAIGFLLTTIPQAVLGGCTIMMFGSIIYAGFRMMSRCGFSDRNMIIVALSLSIGLGFTQATDMFKIFPPIIQSVFAENCVAVVFLLAVILPGNNVLPFGDLATIPFVVAMIVAAARGNIVHSVLAGVIVISMSLLMASVMGPFMTEMGAAANFKMPEGAAMISAIDQGGNLINFVIFEIFRLFA